MNKAKPLLFFAITIIMVFPWLTGCASSSLPSPQDRRTMLETGEVSFAQARQEGWIDEAFAQYYLSFHPFFQKQVPAQIQYDLPFLGMTVTVPDEFQSAQASGNIWMYYVASPSGQYGAVYFHDVPEGQEDPIFLCQEDYESWLSATTPIGALVMVPASEEDALASLPQDDALRTYLSCYDDAPEKLGTSSDGSVSFFRYSSADTTYDALWRQTQVQLSDPIALEPEPGWTLLDTPHLISDLGDFSTQDLQGNNHNGDIFSAADLTMVYLWATTCSYCIDEMPALSELESELQQEGKAFQIVGICLDLASDGSPAAQELLQKALDIEEATDVSFPSLIPDAVMMDGALSAVAGTPTVFFLDKEGHLVGNPLAGAREKEAWRTVIEERFILLDGEKSAK